MALADIHVKKPREAQALMTIPQRATHAPCETLMGINGFGGH